MKKADPGTKPDRLFALLITFIRPIPSDASNIGNPCITRWERFSSKKPIYQGAAEPCLFCGYHYSKNQQKVKGFDARN